MLSFTQGVIISNTTVFHHIPNAEPGEFENTTRCMVFLATFEVFGNVVNTVSFRHDFNIKTKPKEKTETVNASFEHKSVHPKRNYFLFNLVIYDNIKQSF